MIHQMGTGVRVGAAAPGRRADRFAKCGAWGHVRLTDWTATKGVNDMTGSTWRWPGRALLGLFVAAWALLGGRPVTAQEPDGAGLRVSMDCQGWVPGCDFDYLRTEMPWIGWVRNRQDAAVHVLVSTQETGAGGRAYTMILIGREAQAGRTDTLSFASPPAATDDEQRSRMARMLRIGLVPFAARTGLREGLEVGYAGAAAESAQGARAAVEDPWNRWVFRVGARTQLSGESLQSSKSFEGSVDASRITSGWKIETSLDAGYDESRYTLEDSTTTTAIQRSYGFDGLAVKSVGGHWSAGLTGSLRSSTYANEEVAARLAPGVEYDVFPYSESTRRRLTILYTVGPAYRRYDRVTIYGKTTDRMVSQRMDVALSVRQPWGTIYSSLQGRHILGWSPDLGAADPEAQARADATKYRLSWFGDVEVNLLRGLSLEMRGRYSRVHDQISLPADEASDEDILLRLRELQTDYTYQFSVGLSYTFGSIFNNIVNPRFDAM